MSDNYYTPAPPPGPPKTKTKSVPVWAWILGGLLAVAIIVGITIGVTSRDDNDSPAPQPTATVEVTKEAEPEKVKETIEAAPELPAEPNYDAMPPSDVNTKEGFSEYMKDIFPVLADVPDKTITDYAESVCTRLDSGKSFAEIIMKDAPTKATASEAEAYGGIAGAAVGVLCPEHADQLREDLQGS